MISTTWPQKQPSFQRSIFILLLILVHDLIAILQISLPGTESMISGFSYTGPSHWSKPFHGQYITTWLTPPRTSNSITSNFSPQISAGDTGTLRDHTYPLKG